MKKLTGTKPTFYSLMIIFVLLILFFVAQGFDFGVKWLFPLAGVLGLLFLVQGFRLILLAKKEKGKLKFFLILTGSSAIAPLPSAILHNIIYALGIMFEDLQCFLESLSAVFFILAVLVAPILFVIGALSLIILLLTQKKA